MWKQRPERGTLSQGTHPQLPQLLGGFRQASAWPGCCCSQLVTQTTPQGQHAVEVPLGPGTARAGRLSAWVTELHRGYLGPLAETQCYQTGRWAVHQRY
jgi:hypothetical protein